MKKITLLTMFCAIFTLSITIAQTATHRLKSKYIITKNKLTHLESIGFKITGANDSVYQLCDNSFKVLISQSNGILKLDPWGINPEYDPCKGKGNIINSFTLNQLVIDMNKRTHVGQPTRPLVLPYRTWIIGISAIALKVRPRITDIDQKSYSSNVISGNISLGPSIGYSFGWTTFTHRSATSWSVTPGISFGFSALSLSKEPLKKKVDITTTPSNLILSPSSNLTLARNDIGIIFSYGWDNMIGKNNDAWAYQGKSFFGIGFAANLKL